MSTNKDDPDDPEKNAPGLLRQTYERLKQLDYGALAKDAAAAAMPSGTELDGTIDAISEVMKTGRAGIEAGIYKTTDDIRDNLQDDFERPESRAEHEGTTAPMMESLAQAQEKDRQALQDLEKQHETAMDDMLRSQAGQRQTMLESLQARGADESHIQEMLTRQQQVFETHQSQEQEKYELERQRIMNQHERELFHPPPGRDDR